MTSTPTAGSVFISYSSQDRAIVSAAALLLKAGGATVFQDVVDLEFGKPWKEALFAAITRCERVMVFWSAAAAASEWVEREWRCALGAGKRIVPMMLDRTPLPPPLADLHGVPDLIELLQAAMRLSPPLSSPLPSPLPPASSPRAPAPSLPPAPSAAIPPPAPRRAARRWTVPVGIGALALVGVVGSWTWNTASVGHAPPDIPGGGPAGITGGSASSGWILPLLLVLLAAVGTAWLLARMQRRAGGSGAAVDGRPVAAPSIASSEFDELGSRFVHALFSDTDRQRQSDDATRS